MEPPNRSVFSITTTLRPWCAAVSAAVIPAAPLPTTTTSNWRLQRRPLSWHLPAPHTRTRYSFGRGCRRGRSGDGGAALQTWDIEADVVVVGFGAAGACAALEAAAGRRDVIVLDRFGGGGATALSGGVVYAGGGTAQQRRRESPTRPRRWSAT